MDEYLCSECDSPYIRCKGVCWKCYKAAWYKANQEKERAKAAAWRKANPEYQATWYKANPEKQRACDAAWRKAHPEECRAYRQKRRALLLGAPGPGLVAMKEYWQTIKHLPCVCSAKGKMTLDHIKPLSKGGHHAPHNVQPLCHSCNSSKGAKDFAEWLASRRDEVRLTA